MEVVYQGFQTRECLETLMKHEARGEKARVLEIASLLESS